MSDPRAMQLPGPTLPIDPILPELTSRLAEAGRAVLEAPPGAGKTTRVPLALDAAGDSPGRIVLLEPRRLAARAAAARLAEAFGDKVGGIVGLRMRGETRVSDRTRIEVVTEGILTRMIQSDPELTGIGTLVFDEFHERSLHADLGLALALEVRAALRPDLRLLVMSATLDAAPVAELLDGAPRLTAEGRSYPVEIAWAETPRPPGAPVEAEVAELVRRALEETGGDVLAFLPGAAEIGRVATRLGDLGPGVEVHPLYGALPFAAQRAAVAPAPPGRRKVVLATAIAETSLTIEGVRAVVDGGLARRAVVDPATAMTQLVTRPVTRAEADQRAGRAGRVAPGRCYRTWTRAQHGSLAAYPPPEIATADLAPLALEMAAWGAGNLPFLTPPPEGALAEARALLTDLGALDASHRITTHGRALVGLPLHPRLAHMLAVAGPGAAPLAALLSDRDPLSGAGVDAGLRLKALAGARVPARTDRAALDRLRAEARRLARLAPETAPRPDLTQGQMAALAYPDRIAQRRPGTEPRYLMSGGRGAILPEADALAGQPWLVVLDAGDGGREARVRLALPLTLSELREVAADRIREETTCHWSKREGRVVAEVQERLGALVLASRPWRDAPAEAVAAALCDGIRQIGLPLSPAADRFRRRVALARAADPSLPDLSDEALMETLNDWLPPWLDGVRDAAGLRALDLLPALRGLLSWEQMQRLDALVPARFTTPLGREVPIDYEDETPSIAVRLQEMFGTTRHPTVAGQPLKVTLLSPAGRPLQITTDLPGFWATSYADVRKDMRGRYPKHPWPEDPTAAPPTLRAKPRG